MDLILGTAGHIDHGKTALVRALTGTDTTHLPEERKRGITIEPGYALLELPPWRLGIVDVPGHEKFVRQMLAGATGMDLALLVVAADDSIKPQTREHFEILRILRLQAGVVAITKSDLVDAGWLELVREEIAGLVAGSFLESAPVVPVSSVTGAGLDELRQALHSAAGRAAAAIARETGLAPFRMAIDRCFPREGFGTVVTGTVGSGRVCVGDSVEIQPQGIQVRVRGLQNHQRECEEVHRGQRAAINLVGVHHDQVRRGDELAASGFLVPSRRMLAAVRMLDHADRPLRDRQRVRLHLGTSELPAVVRTPERSEIGPGESAVVLLALGEAAVATWGQPLVLRQESPAETIGGGQIVHPDPGPVNRLEGDDCGPARAMAGGNEIERGEAAVWFASSAGWNPDDLRRVAGIGEPALVVGELLRAGRVRAVPLSSSRTAIVHQQRLERVGESIVRVLERRHDRSPLRPGFPVSAILAAAARRFPDEIVREVLGMLVAEGRVIRQGETVQLAGRGPQLTRNERAELEAIVDRVREAGIEGPTIRELADSASRARQSVPQLVEIGVGGGDLVVLGDGIVVHFATICETLDRMRERWPPPQRFTVSELREWLGSSRKYVLPLCEYLDRTGATRRDGDWRTLVG